MENSIDLIKIHVEKTDRKNELTFFYNGHMRQLLAAEINIEVLEKMDQKTILSQQPIQVLGNDRPLIKNFLVADALKQEKYKYDQNKKILEVIEKKLKEYA